VTERDSLKDKVVVCVFIFATAGLLLWALIRPWVLRRARGYTPVPG
jgi:hypothetical protein